MSGIYEEKLFSQIFLRTLHNLNRKGGVKLLSFSYSAQFLLFCSVFLTLQNPEKFHFCQWFLPTEGGGCLPHKSGVPYASSEYMREGYFLGSFRKLFECLKIGDE